MPKWRQSSKRSCVAPVPTLSLLLLANPSHPAGVTIGVMRRTAKGEVVCSTLRPLWGMVHGGGAFGHGTVLLSADGKYVLVAAASAVRLYSSFTGDLISSLSGHKRDITAIVLDDDSNNKVLHSPNLCSPFVIVRACHTHLCP